MQKRHGLVFLAAFLLVLVYLCCPNYVLTSTENTYCLAGEQFFLAWGTFGVHFELYYLQLN